MTETDSIPPIDWTGADHYRPVDWRYRCVEHVRRTSRLPPFDADALVRLAVQAYQASRRGAEAGALAACFAEASAIARNGQLRFTAEVAELADYPIGIIADRLAVSPDALVVFHAMHFDVLNRRDLVDFLLRSTAWPEMGLVADRMATRRFAAKAAAILRGKRGLWELLGDDPFQPRFRNETSCLSVSEWTALQATSAQLTDLYVTLCGSDSGSNSADAHARILATIEQTSTVVADRLSEIVRRDKELPHLSKNRAVSDPLTQRASVLFPIY